MSKIVENCKWGQDKFFRTEEEYLEYERDRQALNNKSLSANSTSTHTYIGSGEVKIEPIELATIPEPGPRVDIVDGLIPQNQITILYGDGAQGKSFLALALGAAVASGNPFLGIETLKSDVLYIDWELDVDEHTRRSYKIARGHGLLSPPRGLFYVRAEYPIQKMMECLTKLIREKSFGLVILDSFGAACGGDPEQSRFVIESMSLLRSLKTTILILDHQSKMQEGQKYSRKTPFGSAYKFNLARSVIQSQKVESKPDEISLILHPTKYNLGPMHEEIPVKMSFQDNTVKIELGSLCDPVFSDTLTAEKQILASLEGDGPATAKELAERTTIDQRTTTNCLVKLKKAGRVSVIGKNGRSPIYDVISTSPHTYIGSGEVVNLPIVEQAKEILDAEVLP